MNRITPLTREDLPEFEAAFENYDKKMGFVPNSIFTMAHRPTLLKGFLELMSSISGPPGSLPISPELTRLIAYASSNVAGCRYCQAHTAGTVSRMNGDTERVEAVWEFETSPLFSDAERAALRLAMAAASVPNSATDEHFADLKKHYTEEQIVHIVGTVSIYGFLNRWNDTIATTLEEEAMTFGQTHLAEHGWDGERHRANG